MKIKKSLVALFGGMAYITYLKDIGIVDIDELISVSVNKKREYTPFHFPKLRLIDQNNANWAIAKALAVEKYISEKEVTKQLSTSCYYRTLMNARTIKALRLHNMRTVGDLVKACIKEKKFTPLKNKKKIGGRVNYEIAAVLRKTEFLSQEEFAKVKMPSWRTRILSKEEIGEDYTTPLQTLIDEWPESIQEVILHAITIKFPHEYKYMPNSWCWERITIGQLVQTFVRVRSEGTCFYRKGHHGSNWYMTRWESKKFDQTLDEIEKLLQKLDYIT